MVLTNSASWISVWSKRYDRTGFCRASCWVLAVVCPSWAVTVEFSSVSWSTRLEMRKFIINETLNRHMTIAAAIESAQVLVLILREPWPALWRELWIEGIWKFSDSTSAEGSEARNLWLQVNWRRLLGH